MFSLFSDESRLTAARAVLERLRPRLQSRVCVRLWDGSVVPLGDDADPSVCLRVGSPGVISSLLRKPTLDNMMCHWATGRLHVEGADLHTFVELARVRELSKKLGDVGRIWLARQALPFLLSPADNSSVHHRFTPEAGIGTIEGRT